MKTLALILAILAFNNTIRKADIDTSFVMTRPYTIEEEGMRTIYTDTKHWFQLFPEDNNNIGIYHKIRLTIPAGFKPATVAHRDAQGKRISIKGGWGSDFYFTRKREAIVLIKHCYKYFTDDKNKLIEDESEPSLGNERLINVETIEIIDNREDVALYHFLSFDGIIPRPRKSNIIVVIEGNEATVIVSCKKKNVGPILETILSGCILNNLR